MFEGSIPVGLFGGQQAQGCFTILEERNQAHV
jgi:hypothetical protein